MITSEQILSEQTQRAILHGLHWTASVIELLGVLVIVGGVVAATLWSFDDVRRGEFANAFRSYRANLGRGILLGLEFLIAADIIGMVTIVPSFERLGILAVIIVIRSFLSFSLQIEIEGRWPWRRRVAASDTTDHGRKLQIRSSSTTAQQDVIGTEGSELG
jgi:uncharacterized membrane protein